MSTAIILGGGIAGLSVAAHLAPDMGVTLLEAEEDLGYHASGRSAAMFVSEYGNDVVRALNRASYPYLKAAHVLTPRGILLIAKSGEQSAFEAEAESFAMTRITTQEAKSHFPILDLVACRAAAYRDDAYDLDTHLLMELFRKTARENKCEIVTGAKATDIRFDGMEWHVETAKGIKRARHLINAAGAWADEVAAMAGIAKIGLQPYRRSMARLPAPGGLDTSDWPFVDGVGEAWYAKPDAGGWLVSPSEEDAAMPGDAAPDDFVIAHGIARYSALVTEEVKRIETTWAGLRTFAPDRALVIGPDPVLPQFIWCAGQGGYGFQTAPAAGQLIADLIVGRRPQISSDHIAALAPDRFR